MKTRKNPFLALLILTTATQAADLYWDANGATAGVGGTGNWSANAWRDGSATGTLGLWVDGNRPTFGTTFGIVTLNQNAAVSGLNFTVANNEIRGTGANTLTFSGGTVTSTNGGHEIGALLAGSLIFNPTAGNLGGASTFFIKANNVGLTSVELAATADLNNMLIDDAGAFGPATATVKLTKGILNVGSLSTEAVASATANGSGGGLNLNAWDTELAGGTIRSRAGSNTWNGPITLTANSGLLNRGAAGVKLTLSSTATVNLGANTLTLSPTNTSNGIVLNGNITGTGGITQASSALSGAGILDANSTSTLAGTNTYTGPTQIDLGRLNLTGTLTSNITLAAGTSLQGEGSTTGSLTFGTTGEYYVDLSTPAPGAHFKAGSINAASSTVTIKLASPGTVVTDMVVMESTGGPINGLLSNFSFTGRGTLSFNPGQTQLLFTYTPANLVWKGNQANPTFWDTSTPNWLNGGSPDAFQSQDTVLFNDTADTTDVAVQGPSIEPGSMVFDNTTKAYTLSGSPVTGLGGLTKNGTNKVTITSDSTYIGTVNINAGTVALGDGTGTTGNLGAGSTVNNNGAIETNYTAQKILAYNIGGSGTLSQIGTGLVILTGANTYSGDTIIASGSTLQIGNNTLFGSITGNVVTDGTLTFNRSDAINFGNTISGAGGITKSAGTLVTLSGNNTFTGPVQITTNSALVAGSNTALGSTADGTTVLSGRLELANGVTITGETITITGASSNFNGALQASAAATATWAGPIVINSADARIGAGIDGTLILSGVISDGVGTALNIGAGTGGVGTVVVSGTANTYTGPSNIIRGTLKIGANNALPIGTILDVDTGSANENAIFDLDGFNQTVAGLKRSNILSGGLAGAGTAFVTNTSLTPATFTVDQATSTTYAGRITGNLALVQTGAGTLTLNGPQVDHLGNTTVNGALVIAAAGHIALTPTANNTTNSIGGTGSLTIDGKLIVNLAGADTTPGNTWPLINIGTLTETFGTTFSVDSSLGAFSETPLDSGIWTLSAGGNVWTFREDNGTLSVAAAIVDPYVGWIATFFPGETDEAIIGKDADPDNDGTNNLVEFALNGTPNNGSNNGYRATSIEDTDGDTSKELTLTLAVRKGAVSPVFAGSPLTATSDGVVYTIEGSLDLAFPGSPVSEASPATGPGGLPAEYEYRRFRLDASEGLAGKGFLRAKIEPAP